MKKFLKNYGFYIYILIIIVFTSTMSCVKIEEPIKQETNFTKNDLEHAVIDAQNIIRDSIKQSNSKIKYWSTYNTGLPSGTIESMLSFSGTDYKLSDRVSTDTEYGMVIIKQDNGELVKKIVGHEWYMALNPKDIIK